MGNRTCTIDGCNKPHVAKGYCKAHYNKLLDTNRHKSAEVECVACGTKVMRSSGGGRKYGRTCSTECRRRLTFGWSEELPELHWARMYGATCEWKAPQAPKSMTTRECAWCSKKWLTHQTTAQWCSKRCSKKVGKMRRRAREYNAPGEFRWAEVVRLWRTFDKRCAYCREPVTLDMVQAEHVIPISKQGRNDLSNLLPSCGPCNTDKGTLTLTQWQAKRSATSKPSVITTWTWEDLRYKHLTAVRSAA